MYYVEQHLGTDSIDVVQLFFALTRFSTLVLTYTLFFISIFWFKDIYLFFVSLGLTLDSLINWGLRQAIQDPVPDDALQRDNGSLEYGMPSFMVEHSMFVSIIFLTYAFFWRVKLRTGPMIFIFSYPCLVAAAQLVLQFNTPLQTVVGAAVGILLAVLYQLFLFYVVVPLFPKLMGTRLVKFCKYTNQLCRLQIRPDAEVPVLNKEEKLAAIHYFREIVWPYVAASMARRVNRAVPIYLNEVKSEVEEAIKRLPSESPYIESPKDK